MTLEARKMIFEVVNHPHFVRVWEDRGHVDRYLFDDGERSYSKHGLVAAHQWVVDNPFVVSFPDAPMIHRLRRSESRTPTSPIQPPSPFEQERASRVRENHPFPWERPDEP